VDSRGKGWEQRIGFVGGGNGLRDNGKQEVNSLEEMEDEETARKGKTM